VRRASVEGAFLTISQIKKIFKFSSYFIVLSFCLVWGGFACTGMGGNAGPIGGPINPQGAASPGTITPIADVASTPMTICHDKEGRIIPCPDVIAATADKREYSNDYRISGRNASEKYELISKDFSWLNPFHIPKEGLFYFLLEKFTESTPGDPSTWDYHQADGGAQIRLVVFPRDDSGSYQYVDASVKSVITLGTGQNVSFNPIPMSFGDRVELWLYDKSTVQPDGKLSYETYKGYSETGGSLDKNGFIEFINNDRSLFLGTFRAITDLSDVKVIPGAGTRFEGMMPSTDLVSPP